VVFYLGSVIAHNIAIKSGSYVSHVTRDITCCIVVFDSISMLSYLYVRIYVGSADVAICGR